MSTNFDFASIKSVSKSVQYCVYGYIGRCQKLFPRNNPYYNIPQLIDFMVILYYDKPECFDVNNDTIFDYKYDEHQNIYHIFGTKLIEREYMNEYKWKIKTSESYRGVLGVVDDTNNGSNQIKNGTNLYAHHDFAGVGAFCYDAYKFGERDNSLCSFINKGGDVITISLNYTNDSICFESEKKKKKIIINIKNGIKSVRFIAEFWKNDSTLTLLI